jgi:hypothetical protein
MHAAFIPDSAPPAGETGDSEPVLAGIPNRKERAFHPGFGGKTIGPFGPRLPKLYRNSSQATDGRRASTAKNPG